MLGHQQDRHLSGRAGPDGEPYDKALPQDEHKAGTYSSNSQVMGKFRTCWTSRPLVPWPSPPSNRPGLTVPLRTKGKRHQRRSDILFSTLRDGKLHETSPAKMPHPLEQPQSSLNGPSSLMAMRRALPAGLHSYLTGQSPLDRPAAGSSHERSLQESQAIHPKPRHDCTVRNRNKAPRLT